MDGWMDGRTDTMIDLEKTTPHHKRVAGNEYYQRRILPGLKRLVHYMYLLSFGWLKKYHLLMVYLGHSLGSQGLLFPDRRGLTRCSLEHKNHLVMNCAAIAVFVATRVC